MEGRKDLRLYVSRINIRMINNGNSSRNSMMVYGTGYGT